MPFQLAREMMGAVVKFQLLGPGRMFVDKVEVLTFDGAIMSVAPKQLAIRFETNNEMPKFASTKVEIEDDFARYEIFSAESDGLALKIPTQDEEKWADFIPLEAPSAPVDEPDGDDDDPDDGQPAYA